MKTFQLAAYMTVLLFLFAVPIQVQAAEVQSAISDHQGMAARYEEKAAAQDEIIAEHTKMKEDYREKYFINEKVSPMAEIKKVEKHCDGVIQNAGALKAGFLEFAKWHRMRVAELQGR